MADWERTSEKEEPCSPFSLQVSEADWCIGKLAIVIGARLRFSSIRDFISPEFSVVGKALEIVLDRNRIKALESLDDVSRETRAAMRTF